MDKEWKFFLVMKDREQEKMCKKQINQTLRIKAHKCILDLTSKAMLALVQLSKLPTRPSSPLPRTPLARANPFTSRGIKCVGGERG